MTVSPHELPLLLTASETIEFLRLDSDGGDAKEKLRNLIRRQRLPVIRRGRLHLFRREALERWLAEGEKGAGKTKSPAR